MHRRCVFGLHSLHIIMAVLMGLLSALPATQATANIPINPSSRSAVQSGLASISAANASLIRAQTSHKAPLSLLSVAFSPDGIHLATSDVEGNVEIWNINKWESERTLKHPLMVYEVAYSPDGTKIATASKDQNARLWDVASGEKLAEFPHTGYVYGVAFQPNGSLLASVGDENVSLWDTQSYSGRSRLRHEEKFVEGVAFSPNGTYIAAGIDDATVTVWQISPTKKLYELTGHLGTPRELAFSPDSTRLASSSSGDSGVRLWEVATGKPIKTISGHQGGVTGLAFCTDGTCLATASDDQTVQIWDTQGGQSLAVLRSSAEMVDVAFSTDGTRLAAIDTDGNIQVYASSTSGGGPPDGGTGDSPPPDGGDSPPGDRGQPPPSSVLLKTGRGLSDGKRQTNGNFQVEGYCTIIGYRGVRNSNTDWYCTTRGREYRLQPRDFDKICQLTYNAPSAFAIQNGGSSTPAYNWRCYQYNNAPPPPVGEVGDTAGARRGTCPTSPPSRLRIGGRGRVYPGIPNRLNTKPARLSRDSSSKFLADIHGGEVFTVLDGPVCNHGVTWWKVNFNGIHGWTGESDDDYWVEPVP